MLWAIRMKFRQGIADTSRRELCWSLKPTIQRCDGPLVQSFVRTQSWKKRSATPMLCITARLRAWPSVFLENKILRFSKQFIKIQGGLSQPLSSDNKERDHAFLLTRQTYSYSAYPPIDNHCLHKVSAGTNVQNLCCFRVIPRNGPFFADVGSAKSFGINRHSQAICLYIKYC